MQMMYMDTWSMVFRLDMHKGQNMVMPGEQATVRFTLPSNMPVLEGQLFTLRENKITVGTGRITKLQAPIDFPPGYKLAKVSIKVD